MAAPSARSTARYLHLVRAAQSAGEAFAVHPDEGVRNPGSLLGRLPASAVAWLCLGGVAAVALLAVV